MILFEDDPEFKKGRAFTAAALRPGVYVHPFHNWFLCAAHDDGSIRSALERMEQAFGDARRAL